MNCSDELGFFICLRIPLYPMSDASVSAIIKNYGLEILRQGRFLPIVLSKITALV